MVNWIDPRILGQRIAEARRARGKTQEEVCEHLGCSRPTYIAIEKGERQAKANEIVKLATFFGRNVHDLVRPTEPVVGLQPALRAGADRLKGSDAEQLNAAIDELQRLAEDYRDLERMLNAPLRFNYPAEISLGPRVDASQLGEGAAAQERQRLGLGDQPVMSLRSMLEWDVGLRIFYWELPSTVAGMYASTADLGCCILVNRKHPPERRRLSILREYGHLLVDRFKPGIDYLSASRRKPAKERFAEAFATSFLMPATSVRQRFNDIVNTTGDFQVADLRRLSQSYVVSTEAMALRLEQLGLISKTNWRFLKESRVAPGQVEERGVLRPQPIDDQPFPERYLFLAVHAYEREEIGDSDLAHLLRTDIVTARELAANTLRPLVAASSGGASGSSLRPAARSS
ncbi:MAG: ImmA/IrrE family metallo-endopeptidase [Planctomycetes bacterium]|nr:ImmA/IrrE family metallo-endopeptidase [Planctomycetota bacterium]